MRALLVPPQISYGGGVGPRGRVPGYGGPHVRQPLLLVAKGLEGSEVERGRVEHRPSAPRVLRPVAPAPGCYSHLLEHLPPVLHHPRAHPTTRLPRCHRPWGLGVTGFTGSLGRGVYERGLGGLGEEVTEESLLKVRDPWTLLTGKGKGVGTSEGFGGGLRPDPTPEWTQRNPKHLLPLPGFFLRRLTPLPLGRTVLPPSRAVADVPCFSPVKNPDPVFPPLLVPTPT